MKIRTLLTTSLLALTTVSAVAGYTPPKVIKTETTKHYAYGLYIDCYDKRLSDTGTNNAVTVTFKNSKGKVIKKRNDSASSTVWYLTRVTPFKGAATKPYPRCDKISDAVYATNFYTKKPKIKSIVISTPGKDAFWLDEARLYLITYTKKTKTYDNGSTDTITDMDVAASPIAHWGRDGGNGWCFSKDSNDANGGWKPYLSKSGCIDKRTFKVKDSKVSYRK